MKFFFPFALILVTINGFSQTTQNDSIIVKQIFSEALNDFTSYKNLEFLCNNTAGRIGGSPEASKAVEYTFDLMKNMPFDTVYLQACKVACWKRGAKESGKIISEFWGESSINVCALGSSPGTGNLGISSTVIEVADIDELKKLDPQLVKGKIVFFNKPFNQEHFYTFKSYSEVSKSRFLGPVTAGDMGAAAVIVRSMTHILSDNTHTGITKNIDVANPIPSFAISTNDAEKLSLQLKEDKNLEIHLESFCQLFEDVTSYNVIGEIRGTTYPERIITVGGHLDAWDIGQGAHDDGVGCMQSIEVARIFFKLNIKPQNTLRVVMFMDEEMNQRGGKAYAAEIIHAGEQHYFAFESDRGGFSPLGFSIDADSAFIEKTNIWFGLLYDYGIYRIEKGYSGVDIAPLKKYNIPLAALITDSQRYFDYQHANSDVFEAVNRREMQLGSAAMASFIYFMDKYGY
jgi:carboxypeptidase Q